MTGTDYIDKNVIFLCIRNVQYVAEFPVSPNKICIEPSREADSPKIEILGYLIFLPYYIIDLIAN